jgi:uncharacterized protein
MFDVTIAAASPYSTLSKPQAIAHRTRLHTFENARREPGEQPWCIRELDDILKLILGGRDSKEGVGVTDFGSIVIDTDGRTNKNDTLKSAHDAADRFESSWSILAERLVDVVATPEFAACHAAQCPTAAKGVWCPDLAVCGGGMPAHRCSDERGFDRPSPFCTDQQDLTARLRDWLRRARRAAA